jgi:ParB-like chromosome segregation protein Spo0J
MAAIKRVPGGRHAGRLPLGRSNSLTWRYPLLVDSDGTIIAGEGRYLAARKLGLLEAPVIELTGLSEAQCRALALADNRIPLPVVRRLVGYGRFDGVETARVMARVYAAARLLVDFFQPS